MAKQHEINPYRPAGKMKISIGSYMIREWRSNDVEAIAKYANNREIALQLRDGFPFPYTEADAEQFIARATQMESGMVFAIATESEAIGSIGLISGKDVHRLSAELGYWLAEPFWNKGIMTKAVRSLVDHAFTASQLNRIFAEPYTTNPASASVLKKAGFTLEGILRANVIKQGRILDQYLYARLRDGITPVSSE